MPTIAEVRKQYPDYNDLSDQQLADALHSKFYSDMPKEEFQNKIGLTTQIQPAISHKQGDYLKVSTQNSWKDTLSKIARPVLQTGGMVGGGIIGSGATPVAGTVAGAGLGYAGGEQVANLLDQYLGKRTPMSVNQELLQAAKDVGTGATYEMGGGIAGKAIPATAKLIGKGAKQLLGATTGAGSGTMDEALKGGKAFTDAMRGKTPPDEIVDNVRSALQEVKAQRASAYTDKLVEVTANKTPIDISPIKSKLYSLVKQYGGKFNADGTIDLSRIAMGKSGRRDIFEIINTINGKADKKAGGLVGGWGSKEGDNTAVGLDTLKRQLDDFYSDSSQARQFVTSIRNAVKDTIVKDVPEYADMTKGYASATGIIKDIEAGLMLRKQGMTGRVTGDMTLRRLMSAMKSNNELRLDLLNVLGRESGEDLTGQVAGYVSSDIVPRGLIGKLAGGSAFFMSYLNPKFYPLLAASSPRVVGEFLKTYGKALKVAGKAGPEVIPSIVKGAAILNNQPPAPEDLTAEYYLKSLEAQ